MRLTLFLLLTVPILYLQKLNSMESPLPQSSLLKLVSTCDKTIPPHVFTIPRDSAEKIDTISQIMSDLSITDTVPINIPINTLDILVQLIEKEYALTHQNLHTSYKQSHLQSLSLCAKISTFFSQLYTPRPSYNQTNQSLFSVLDRDKDVAIRINRLPLKEKVDLYKHAHRIGCDEIATYMLYRLRMPINPSYISQYDPGQRLTTSGQSIRPEDARTYWNQVYSSIGTETNSIKEILLQQKNSPQPLQSLTRLQYTFDQLKAMGILKLVITSSLDGTAIIWDWTTGRIMQIFIHEKPVHGAIASPDLTQLATFSLFDIFIWNFITGQKLLKIDHLYSISNVRYIPDGTKIITLTSDGAANVFDTCTGSKLYRLHANPRIFDEQIYSISSSADSRLITTTSKYGEKKLWNAHTGQEIALVTTRHLASNPVFSRDGTKLATTYNNGIIIWDMPTMKKIQTIQQCNAASIQFTKDNTQLITPITGTNFVTIWDIASGRKITTLNEVTWPKNDPLNSKKLSPDGTLHLQALDESTLQLSNIRAESVIGTVGHKNTHQKIVFTKFSPDSTKLAIVSTLSPRGAILTLTMWDTASGTKKWRFSQSDWIYKTHFSADSQQLLIFDSNKAQLLDCATGRILAVFKHTQNLSSAHFVN